MGVNHGGPKTITDSLEMRKEDRERRVGSENNKTMQINIVEEE